MKKIWYLAIGVVLVIVLLYVKSYLTIEAVGKSENLNFFNLPEGYQIEVFADDLGGSPVSLPGPNKGVRMLDYKDGIFYATLPGRGEVIALHDLNNDWKIDQRTTFISDLLRPHGVALQGGYVYISGETEVIRAKDLDGDFVADETEHLVDLPEGTHWTRTIKIFDNEMYISIGSTCNVCEEEDDRHATIIKCDLDGSSCQTFATGLRNSVDMTYHKGEIWVTDNGRDLLDNDIPPDEINVLKEGRNYGWPICYGKQIHDTDFDKKTYIRNPCEDTESSLIDLQAHSAPLGLTFYNDDLLVAYHGSWNRQPPTGYKIVKVNIETGVVKDFVTGWFKDGTVYGRPVDLLVVDDNIFVTDDVAGKIYRIWKN
jgi:glucose/arabinose dehydrogenase